MMLAEEETIPLPIDVVWQGFNDPEVLRLCIPGCEEVVKVDDTHYTIKLLATVGPVRVKFAGTLETRDMRPPHSYSLVFEGKGGAAGFAKGKADVELVSQGDAQTLLRYGVDAQIGGKLAQIGARLVDSVAAKTAKEFFANFIATMAPKAAAAAPPPEPEAPPARRGIGLRAWLAGAGLAVVCAAF